MFVRVRFPISFAKLLSTQRSADHGAERRLTDLVLDGTRDDARDAPAPHPRVVAEEAVERVEDRGVAAELELRDTPRPAS